MRSSSVIVVALLCAAALACGDDGGAAPDAASADGAVADTEAPEIRDFRVTIEGDLGVSLELNSRDGEHIIPQAGTAEFTVLGRDDVTAAENLAVAIVDDADQALSVLDSEFRNGLWRVRVDVAPGDVLRTRVADEADNQATSEHALRLPPLSGALTGAWEIWFFDATETITHKWLSEWNADGTWSETRQDTGLSHGGDWTIDGELLQVAETTNDGADPDSDPDTVERRRDAAFYVDGTYFSVDPFARTGTGSGLQGSWERSWSVYEPGDGGLELAEAVTQTLTLETDTWSGSRTVIDHRSGSPVETTTTRAGTYRVELNDNYTEAVGDFLVRKVTEVDGQAVDEPESWELHIVRLDHLMLSPMLRAGG